MSESDTDHTERGAFCITIVGQVNAHVEALLSLTVPDDRNIYISPGNIAHMQSSHPQDFARYGADIELILAAPDYVGQNPKDGSIEYVKEYRVNNDFVKVAVRLSGGSRYYARSLYVLNNNRVKNYIAKGTLKKT